MVVLLFPSCYFVTILFSITRFQNGRNHLERSLGAETTQAWLSWESSSVHHAALLGQAMRPASLSPSLIFTWAVLSTLVADICLYRGNVSQFPNWEAGLQRLCSPLGSPQPCSAGGCEPSPLMCF